MSVIKRKPKKKVIRSSKKKASKKWPTRLTDKAMHNLSLFYKFGEQPE